MTTHSRHSRSRPRPSAAPQREHRRLLAEGRRGRPRVRRARARDLSRLPRRGHRNRGVSRRRSRVARADQRPRRGRAARRRSAISAPRTPAALVEAGAPFVAARRSAEVVMALPGVRDLRHDGEGARRARRRGAARARITRFRSTACLRAITPNTRLVYINNPNNPTGQPVPKDAIRRHRARSRPRAGVRGRGVSRLHGRELSRRGAARIPTSSSAARSRRRTAWPACASA